MKIISTPRRMKLFWQLAKQWFTQQFEAVASSIDFTPIAKDATVAKQGSNPDATNTAILTAVEQGGGTQLMPTAEVIENGVRFHFITLAQMEKTHIRATGVGAIGFTLTKGENNFELRFSADSPQEIAGQLVLDDSIEIVDDVFGTITIPLEGYVVSGVYIDGVDANLLEADINWRVADIQKRIGEGGEDPNSKALAEFFGVTLLQGYEFMTDTEVTDELENIMQALDPELLQEVEYPEGSGTYMTKAQAITAQAMQIINPSKS